MGRRLFIPERRKGREEIGGLALYHTGAEGRQEPTLHGVLPSLAGGEWPGRLDLYCDRRSVPYPCPGRSCSAARFRHFQLLICKPVLKLVFTAHGKMESLSEFGSWFGNDGSCSIGAWWYFLAGMLLFTCRSGAILSTYLLTLWSPGIESEESI
jgi:hypothetical protein